MQKQQKQPVSQNAGCKILGGLVIVDPLAQFSLDEIYKKIVEPIWDLSDIEPSQRVIMEMVKVRIYERLRQRPTEIQHFIEHYSDFNQIEWANLLLECKENACKNCHLEYTPDDDQPNLYKANVDQKFCECSELTKNSSIEFVPQSLEKGQKGKSYRGEVLEIDTRNWAVYVEIKGRPAPGKYEATILTNAMVFDSRCRTLDRIGNFDISIIEGFIFGKARERFAQNLISLDQFNENQHQFYSMIQFSKRRQFNKKQKEAIHAIVSGLHQNCPFILFGPPGTGKTVTLVETVRLVVEQNPANARILVCTPSNTAADNFALELLGTGAFRADSILRIYSLSKKVEDQNPNLISTNDGIVCICQSKGFLKFGIPPKEKLLEKNVLICTLSTSTYLINGGLRGCFSHIFVDEAGQADELETLIPIIGLIDPKMTKLTRVILAGDPQQLGPVQTCELLKNLAKPASLIERLIGIDLNRQSSFKFDKRITILLEENYRSHPTLVTIPSRLYYGGILRSSAPINERNTLCHWEGLPKKDFPLLWHSIVSAETVDNSNSVCNMGECEVVRQYVYKLTKNAKVQEEEIGIIAPYRYQVRRLQALIGRDFPKIDIDSVERFQGSERRVIIISTVRSCGVGFLDNYKRFNTAITRPKELLIIVGNSENIGRIHGWQTLIEYCRQNGSLIFHSDEFINRCSDRNKEENNSTEINKIKEILSERKLRQLKLQRGFINKANNQQNEGKNDHSAGNNTGQSSGWDLDLDPSPPSNSAEGNGWNLDVPPPSKSAPKIAEKMPRDRNKDQISGRLQKSSIFAYSYSDSEEEDENSDKENQNFAVDFGSREVEQQFNLEQNCNGAQHLSEDSNANTNICASLSNIDNLSIKEISSLANPQEYPLISMADKNAFQELVQRMGLRFEVRRLQGAISFSSSTSNTHLILDPIVKDEDNLTERIRFSLYKNGHLELEADWILSLSAEWILLSAIEGIFFIYGNRRNSAYCKNKSHFTYF